MLHFENSSDLTTLDGGSMKGDLDKLYSCTPPGSYLTIEILRGQVLLMRGTGKALSARLVYSLVIQCLAVAGPSSLMN